MKKEYEITGAKVPFFLEADSFHVAVVAVLMLGGGRLGLKPLFRGGDGMPEFHVPDSIDVFVRTKFSMSHPELLRKTISPEHIHDLIRTMDSVTIGLPGENGKRPYPERGHNVKHRAMHLHKQLVKAYAKRFKKPTKH